MYTLTRRRAKILGPWPLDGWSIVQRVSLANGEECARARSSTWLLKRRWGRWQRQHLSSCAHSTVAHSPSKRAKRACNSAWRNVDHDFGGQKVNANTASHGIYSVSSCTFPAKARRGVPVPVLGKISSTPLPILAGIFRFHLEINSSALASLLSSHRLRSQPSPSSPLPCALTDARSSPQADFTERAQACPNLTVPSKSVVSLKLDTWSQPGGGILPWMAEAVCQCSLTRAVRIQSCVFEPEAKLSSIPQLVKTDGRRVAGSVPQGRTAPRARLAMASRARLAMAPLRMAVKAHRPSTGIRT